MRIGFHQVTATRGIHSLYEWCYQTIWLFSGPPEHPEDDSLMEKHGANRQLYPALMSVMHAIQMKDEEAGQDAAHRMIQIQKPWIVRRLSESNLVNGKPLVHIPNENAHLINHE